MSKARVEWNTYRGPAKPELGGVSLVFPVRNEFFMLELPCATIFRTFSRAVHTSNCIVESSDYTKTYEGGADRQ